MVSSVTAAYAGSARPPAEAADAPPSAPAGEPLAAETEAGTARSWTELGGIAQVSFQDEPAEETTGRATLLGAREGCYVYSYGYQAPLPDLQQAPEAVREQYDTLYDAFRDGLILTFTDTTGGRSSHSVRRRAQQPMCQPMRAAGEAVI